jgi:hypothetical protein
MADPQIPGGIRVLSILQSVTGLPEDVFVNTWAFRTASGTRATDGELNEAAVKIADFFGANVTLTNASVNDQMSGEIDPTACELKVYRMDDPPPREPEVYPLPWSPQANGTVLPAEVALCMSFYSGRNIVGRRGRVYLGPWQDQVLTPAEEPARPQNTVLQTIMAAGERLMTPEGTTVWCVLAGSGSGTAALHPVTGGWVDDAFDTQRRRGAAPTTRLQF